MKKIYTPIIAAVMALGISTASVTPAEAGRGGRVAAGIAIGLVAGAILYSAHKNNRRYYKRHKRRHVSCRHPTRRWHGHRAWGGEGHRHWHCGRHYH